MFSVLSSGWTGEEDGRYVFKVRALFEGWELIASWVALTESEITDSGLGFEALSAQLHASCLRMLGEILAKREAHEVRA